LHKPFFLSCNHMQLKKSQLNLLATLKALNHGANLPDLESTENYHKRYYLTIEAPSLE
jgi:hypothetical protein